MITMKDFFKAELARFRTWGLVAAAIHVIALGFMARVLEKAGYMCEGRLRKSVTKDGQTIDQLMYAMIRE